MNHYLRLLIFGILTFSLFSCEVDNECRQTTYVMLKSGFYRLTLNTTTGKYTSSTLSVDSLWIHGLDNDSLLYNNEKTVSSVELPMRKFHNQTDFVIRFNNTTDTLTILHKDTIQYLSLECGCIKTYTVDTVLTTNHFIDSVQISNHAVNTTNAENIKIYH